MSLTSARPPAGQGEDHGRPHTLFPRRGKLISTKSRAVGQSSQERLAPHLRWELEQVMTVVQPADLSAAELAGLLGILRLAHARVIGSPAGRPRLRLLGVGGEHAAPKLA